MAGYLGSRQKLIGVCVAIALIAVGGLTAFRVPRTPAAEETGIGSLASAPDPTPEAKADKAPAMVELGDSALSDTGDRLRLRWELLADLCNESDLEIELTRINEEMTNGKFPDDEKGWQLLVDKLSVSSSASHLQVAAKMTKDRQRSIALIEKAMELAPTDAHIAHDAVQLCALSGGTPCPSKKWAQHLLSMDSDNSLSWVLVSVIRYDLGDATGALEALSRAGSATAVRTYWRSATLRNEDALAAATNLPFTARAMGAIGLRSAEVKFQGKAVAMCQKEAANSFQWAYACRDYGEQLESYANSTLELAIGATIQSDAWRVLGDKDQRDDAINRAQLRSRGRGDLGRNTKTLGDSTYDLDLLVLRDPTTFAKWLALTEHLGESAAIRLLREETDGILDQRVSPQCQTTTGTLGG